MWGGTRITSVSTYDLLRNCSISTGFNEQNCVRQNAPKRHCDTFLKFQSHKYTSSQTTHEIFLVTKQSVHTLAKDRRHGILVVITKRTLPKFFSMFVPPQNIKIKSNNKDAVCLH